MPDQAIRLLVPQDAGTEIMEQFGLTCEGESVIDTSYDVQYLFQHFFKGPITDCLNERASTTIIALLSSFDQYIDFVDEASLLHCIAKEFTNCPGQERFNVSFHCCGLDGELTDYLNNNQSYKYHKNKLLLSSMEYQGLLRSLVFDSLDKFTETYGALKIDMKKPINILYRFSIAYKDDNPLQIVSQFVNVIVLRTDNCNPADDTMQSFITLGEYLCTGRRYLPVNANFFTQALKNTNSIKTLLFLGYESEDHAESMQKIHLFKLFYSITTERVMSAFCKAESDEKMITRQRGAVIYIKYEIDRVYDLIRMIREFEPYVDEYAVFRMLDEGMSLDEVLREYDVDQLLGVQ